MIILDWEISGKSDVISQKAFYSAMKYMSSVDTAKPVNNVQLKCQDITFFRQFQYLRLFVYVSYNSLSDILLQIILIQHFKIP